MDDAMTTGDASDWRFFHLRNWLGMPLSVWLPLLARNRLAVSRIGQTLRTTAFAAGNSVLHRLDQLVYGARIARSPAPRPPLFVIGHWRSGTTLLHELLVLDRQFGYPTTYQTMAPHHFVLSERWVPKLLAHAVPTQRPMDGMPMSFDHPQEDEFALCNLGLPSPYLRWAFPNHYTTPGLYLDIDELSDADRRRWIEGLRTFIHRLAWRDPRRMVLKSPTHTARAGTLAAIFPGTQFVHIVRNPFEIFASTVHTWRRLWNAMGLQTPDYDGLDEYVLETFVRMQQSLERARSTLGPEQLHEVRYEQLVAAPLTELERIYDRLGLAGFDEARPAFEAYFAERREYRPNRHALSDELRTRIARRWKDYFERYGYDTAGRTSTACPA